MKASRSSPRFQSPALRWLPTISLGAGGLVDADQLLDPGADVADVELVGDRVLGDRVAVGVDHDPAVAAVAQQADQRRGVVPALMISLCSAPERHGIAPAVRPVVDCAASNRKP